ncbi:MAG: hypothetical protein KDB00_00715 [Planctomycetales bacterium]|nr:hypothetical protein [Planctomycetales bacterium]
MNGKGKSGPITVDDLQDLYSELRGSRSAPAIMDARALFLERQWSESHTKLTEAYEKYSESRQRILRQDPEKQVDAKATDRDRQIRRLQRKQEKAKEIIEKFEEYLPQLERLAEKEKAKDQTKERTEDLPPPQVESSAGPESAGPESASPESASPVDTVAATKQSFDSDYVNQFSELIGDRQLDFVSQRFDFRPLSEPDDVVVDAVYLLRRGDRCLLIHAGPSAEDNGKLHCVDIHKAKNNVTLSRRAMVKLSQKRKLVLLVAKSG